MTVVYKCATCGAFFYFYGKQAELLRQLVRISKPFQEEFEYELPLAYKVVEAHAKCCKSPFVYRHVSKR